MASSIITKLTQLLLHYENNTSGQLEIQHGIQTILDYSKPNRQEQLAKFIETLKDMRRYSNDNEATLIDEILELLLKGNCISEYR